jgi:hypothetical protein
MKRRTIFGVLCLAITLLLGVCQVASAARKKPEVPLTAQGEKLLATYTDMLSALRKEIAASAPTIDQQKKTDFLAAYAAVESVPTPPNPKGLTNAPPRYADSNPPYKEAQEKAVTAAAAVLSDVDAFLASDKLHGQLVKCALLVDATPRGLAEFAQQGKEHEALVTNLLADEALMKRIMEMGGAYEGKYGQAMQIYTAIQKASERAKEGVFQQLALGSALEHPDGNIKKEGKTATEVMVEMYLDYEQAYLNKKLDSAFGTYVDWEYRFIFPRRSVEDVTWLRETMRNYRPDHLTMKDHKWRYVRIVKTDVPYTSNVDRSQWDDLEFSFMQKIFFKGGICGPRAFMGKLSTATFGIPTRGAAQTGHAAMSRWTPDGWTTVLGAHWTHNRWRGRCGMDFFLETQARQRPDDYMKVLRSQWLGDAYGESPVNGMNYGIGGGLWHALAFYRKLAIVEEAKLIELAPTGEELAESNVEATTESIPQIEIPDDAKKITVGKSGVITIPVAACTAPKSTEKVRFMHSIDGGIQVHYNLAGNRPELLRYTVEAPAAGKYELTANVVTITLNGGFLLRLNRRTMVDVEVPYTVGKWEHTKPVTIDLKEGRNSLQFTVRPPNKGLSIKDFTLTPVK